MSRILLVAPVPTHPTTTGTSSRVRYMAESLLSFGHEVHYLHIQQELGTPHREMQRFWEDRLHVFRGLSVASCLHRGRRKVMRVTAKTFHFNLSVDSHFDPACSAFARRVLARLPFDAVIVSYVFYSKVLEVVPDRVLKIIDTHDVFSDRYRLYREQGLAGEFFSTGKEGEKRALDRADAVLAIQEWDASHFRSLSRTPVTVVGHLAPVADATDGGAPQDPPAMLFVGGPMAINAHGVAWFIEQVLPAVRRHVPEAELWLVGGICDRLRQAPGVRPFGFVDAVGDVYRRAAVVVNPQHFGTGLSIKSVDALRHGRPLVTTASGARGLEEGSGAAYLQAGSAEAFAEFLVELLRDPDRRAALADRAADFARRYYGRNLQALAEVVNRAGSR